MGSEMITFSVPNENIYVGDGKGADALDAFFRRVRKYEMNIEYVATDLSAAFISAVRKNLPEASWYSTISTSRRLSTTRLTSCAARSTTASSMKSRGTSSRAYAGCCSGTGRTSRQMLRRNSYRRLWKSTSRWQRHTI